MLFPSEEALCSARAAAPVLPGPRNEARESPPRDPLQLDALRRGVYREQHGEASAVKARRCEEGVLQADEQRAVREDNRERGAARRTDIKQLNDMEKARKLAETPHCVDFRVFDGQLAPPEEQVEVALAEEQQQQQKALVGIEMRQLNHFINSRLPTASASWSIAS